MNVRSGPPARVLGIPKGDAVYSALEDTRLFLNARGLTISGMVIVGTDMNGNPIVSAMGDPLAEAIYVGTIKSGNWTVNIWRTPPQNYFELIRGLETQSMLPGFSNWIGLNEEEYLLINGLKRKQ